jgi:hypothetical protein
MDEHQIKTWLGCIGPEFTGRSLKACLIEGMADVPFPRTAQDEMTTFRAFLQVCRDNGIEAGSYSFYTYDVLSEPRKGSGA